VPGLPAGRGVGSPRVGRGPLLKTVVEAGVPVLVFFAMAVVGIELTTDDFRRVARPPGTVVAATVGQFVLLLVIGWLLVCCIDLFNLPSPRECCWWRRARAAAWPTSTPSWALLFNASMQPHVLDMKMTTDTVKEVRQAVERLEQFSDIDLFAEFP
jgi:hypothetical protein